MKTEQKQLSIFLLKMVALITFASLYAIGGSGDFWGGQLWIRRFLAPLVLMTSAFILSKEYKYVIAYPFMVLALTLPYGSDILWQKILLRSLFGVACALAYNIPNLLKRNWWLSSLGTILVTVSSIILGTFNPTPNAVVEQGAIAVLIGFTYIIGASKKETKNG